MVGTVWRMLGCWDQTQLSAVTCREGAPTRRAATVGCSCHFPVVELCSVTVDHAGDDRRRQISSASAHTDVSGAKRGNASMEGLRDSAPAAQMTFNDEGVQPLRHPKMTLIKIRTQGRFFFNQSHASCRRLTGT